MRKALTIGELLVTMAIIGVISVLVLPSFMQNYHKKIYVAKLKKTVEMLDTAINQACIDNNVSNFFHTPYVMVSKDEEINDGVAGSGQQAFLDKYFKKVTSGTNAFADSYRYIKKTESQPMNSGQSKRYGLVKLADGQSVRLFCDAGASSKEEENYRMSACIFTIDVNGPDGPNVGGRDLFAISIQRGTNKLIDGWPTENCGTEDFGYGCFAKIVEDNWEMNY